MTSPCRNCEKREPGCHSVCPEYLKFSEDSARRRAERVAAISARAAELEMIQRRKRRNHAK